MDIKDIDYSSVAVHIPYVMQSLYPEQIRLSTSLVEMRDAFRINQMQGKAWLLDQIKEVDRNSTILVVGSWFGFTSYCLYKMGFKFITETDPDIRLELMSNYLNRENVNFRHFNKDVNDLDMLPYDLVINTSCEHISNNNWFNNIPTGKLVLLQSTNFKCDDHINVVSSVEEMKSKYLLNYKYANELKFNPQFSRFMLYGEKV